MTDIPYYPSITPPQLSEPTPVQLAVAEPAGQRRATVAFRIILVIPHWFVLYFLMIAAAIVAFLGWWGALFMGRLPDFAVSYLTGFVRWYVRVQAYTMLLTDIYPPFTLEDDPSYPVRITVSQERLNRAAVFFRFILAIPAGIVTDVVSFGATTIVIFIAWLITLITGKLPVSLHQAFTAVVRYSTRTWCYSYLLTPTYPGGLFGDGRASETLAPTPPAPPGPGYGGPGYGGPVYGGPVYGAPGAGYAAPRPVFQPASWQLVLTSAAKRLLVLFIVLGVLTGAGYVVSYVALIAGGVQGFNNVDTAINASRSVNTAYNTLSGKFTQAESALAACNGKLSCLTAEDSTVSSDFSAFANAVQATPVPTNAVAAENKLYADAAKVAQDFTQLSQSATPEEYQSTVASTGVQQAVAQIDVDYNTLISALRNNI